MPATPNVPLDTYDALLTTTLRNYSPNLEDNVFTQRALLNWLKSKNRIKSKDSGTAIVEPIMYGLNDTASSYFQYDTIATTPQDGITAAQYDWSQYAASIAISGLELAQNRGEAALINLLDAKRKQAEGTISEKFNYLFLQDGAGNSGKDCLGIKAIVSTTDSAYGSAALGGIAAASTTTRGDGSSFNYWQCYSPETTTETLKLSKLSHSYNGASAGTNDFPDVAMTTQTLFETYESLLQPQLRFSNPQQADAGFQNLMYKGTTVFWDIYVPSGFWYFLNSEYLTVYTLAGKWMETTDFYRPPNQDAKFAQIISYFQMVTNCRFKHTYLSNKS